MTDTKVERHDNIMLCDVCGIVRESEHDEHEATWTGSVEW